MQRTATQLHHYPDILGAYLSVVAVPFKLETCPIGVPIRAPGLSHKYKTL